MNQRQIDEKPQIAAFFERMTFLPLEHITAMVPPGGAGIGMHVIPVEKAIETENQTADIEHISHWLKKYAGKYAASPCSCRMSRARMGEGCGDDPEGWCIAVGDMADYVVETDKGGRYITYEEVLDILKRPRTTALSTRSPTSTGKTRSSPSAIATSTYATPCAPANCLILLTCPAPPTWRR